MSQGERFRQVYGGDQVAVAVDGAIQVAPAATDLQIRLIYVPGTSFGTTLATAALPKFGGQDRGEFRFPLGDGFVAEDDPALEEHLTEILRRKPVA
ncbi:MAG TPA: hypothetical protein VNZ61_26165 [Roseomonas sp.]|nr:hypothetical protein [Roseomonas sp.]